jgi:hypothetical protein
MHTTSRHRPNRPHPIERMTSPPARRARASPGTSRLIGTGTTASPGAASPIANTPALSPESEVLSLTRIRE